MSVRIVFGCDRCGAELAVLVDAIALAASHALEGLRLAGWEARAAAAARSRAVPAHLCAACAPRARLRLVVKAHPPLAKASPRRAG